MTRAVLWLFGFVLPLGCASVRAPAPDSQTDFTFRTGWGTARARLEGNALFGRGVNVVQTPDGYRGWTGQRLIHLSARGSRLVGFVGEETADLQVEPLAEGVLIHGTFGGEGGSLAVTKEQVVGRIGTCIFDFHRDPGATSYLGPLTRDRIRLQLGLPTLLAGRPPQERAAFLSFFLLQLCRRTAGHTAHQI
jgi:hypothetical protein